MLRPPPVSRPLSRRACSEWPPPRFGEKSILAVSLMRSEIWGSPVRKLDAAAPSPTSTSCGDGGGWSNFARRQHLRGWWRPVSVHVVAATHLVCHELASALLTAYDERNLNIWSFYPCCWSCLLCDCTIQGNYCCFCRGKQKEACCDEMRTREKTRQIIRLRSRGSAD